MDPAGRDLRSQAALATRPLKLRRRLRVLRVVCGRGPDRRRLRGCRPDEPLTKREAREEARREVRQNDEDDEARDQLVDRVAEEALSEGSGHDVRTSLAQRG